MENTRIATSTTASQRLPALFVSHGSPMFALEAGETGPALQQWGHALRAQFPQLRGVVIMSPHWMASKIEVMAHPNPPTWHDFGGFPPALYQLQYPAKGDPELAQTVVSLLDSQGFDATLNPNRPMDHGAWVPLMHLFPHADMPVVQVALPHTADARMVYAMGKALQKLREQGVLIVGSGSMTHNLREFFGGAHQAADYVVEFSRWIETHVQVRDMQALLDWHERAPHALRAHPTDEHFLPLYLTLGAGGEAARVEYLSREVMYGILAMDAFALHN